MSEFLDKLILTPLDETRRFLLVEDLRYYCSILDSIITVPAGFDTDGASVPLGFRWLFPFGGKKMTPAVVHDWLYRVQPVCREVADKIFLEAMEAKGVGPKERATLYRAVKYFGGATWQKHAAQTNASTTR